MAHDLRFGLFLGQFNASWDELVERFALAEELGYDYAWLVDHFKSTNSGSHASCMEAWTLLAGLAASTSRIRLGVLVSGNTYRHPSLLMKEAVTVDHISNGRLLLGIGAGWYEPEHTMYGFDLPTVGERVDRLEEALQIMHSLMTQERTTFHGRYYRLEEAEFDPRPVQQPRIPIVIGAHRPRMLRLVARYADMWDTFPTLDESATAGLQEGIEERLRVLEGYCRELGRNPAEIRKSTWTGGDALHSEAAFLDFVEPYRRLGFTDFTTGLPGPNHMDTVRRIARETIPAIRANAT